jgi:MoaA/NifB/PqqE/SkfB family radical SAM enzyme
MNSGEAGNSEYFKTKSFCPAPWVSLYIDPTGKVENCCISDNNLGNINQISDVKEIIFGQPNKDIQKLILDDQFPKGCSRCSSSSSNTLQKRMLQIFPNINNELYQEGKFELKYLDVRWSNTCNLACIYCGPQLSSTWANELNVVHRINRLTKHNLLEYVLDNVHTLKEVYMAGGEPLLMKENELLIDAILQKNPECHVLVNTNLTQIKDSPIFKNLLKLPNCSWLVSMDATEERFEYLRYPAKWDEFKDNFELLTTQVDNRKIAINMVFTSINALTYWDTVNYVIDTMNVHSNNISLALVNDGSSGPLNPVHLPIDCQNIVLEKMNQLRFKSIRGWQNIHDYMSAGIYIPGVYTPPGGTIGVWPWSELLELDRRRGLDSSKIFPELYKYKDTEPK